MYIVLSGKTTERSYVRTYEALRRAFPDWFDLLAASRPAVRALIESGGLSAKKERQLRAIYNAFTEMGLPTSQVLEGILTTRRRSVFWRACRESDGRVRSAS